MVNIPVRKNEEGGQVTHSSVSHRFYDGSGNLVKVIDTHYYEHKVVDIREMHLSYDNEDRLNVKRDYVIRPDGSTEQLTTIVITYDEGGNETVRSEETVRFDEGK